MKSKGNAYRKKKPKQKCKQVQTKIGEARFIYFYWGFSVPKWSNI